jgi:nucleoid-associated protein YgaU
MRRLSYLEDTMGIETRIGIITGLVIVVVASVYFFYGKDSSRDEFVVATGSKVGDLPKVPVAADKDKSAVPAPGGKTPSTAARPAAPSGRPPITTTGGPPTVAQNAPQLHSAQIPSPAAQHQPSRDRPDYAARYRKPAEPTGTSPDPRRSSVAQATPTPKGASLAQAPAPREEQSASHASSETQKPTALRTEPSSELVEATRANVEKPQAPDEPSGGNLAAVSERLRRGAQELIAGVSDSQRKPGHSGPPSASETAKETAPRAGSGETGASLPTGTSTWPKQHKVVSGDTLATIAAQYYGSAARASDILDANSQVKDPRRLKIGEVLVIPEPHSAGQVAAKKTASERSEQAKKAVGESLVKSYQVREGDSLYSIARSVYGDSRRWEEIYQLNKALLKNDAKHLKPGMVIRLPD